jgi:hypothetical protein
LPALQAPLPDGFIGHDPPTSEQEFFHITVAETEAAGPPDAVADDRGREAMVLVAVGEGVHARSMSHHAEAINKLTMPFRRNIRFSTRVELTKERERSITGHIPDHH